MMRRIVAAILCCGLIVVPLATAQAAAQPTLVVATVTPQAAGDAAADLKFQQQRLDFFKERLDLQDKRIGDIGLYLGGVGLLVTIIGVLVPILVLIASYRATREAVSEAKNEARKEIKEQAEKLIRDWLDNDGGKLLLDKAGSILDELEAKRLCYEQLISGLSSRLEGNIPWSEESKQQFNAAKIFKRYQYADLFVRGAEAFDAGQYENAAEYFAKSAATATSRPFEEAMALVNRGFSLSKLGKNEDALVVFDEVISRFGDSSEAGIRDLVAMALNVSGLILLAYAKKHRKEGADETATAMLKQALAKIEGALERSPDKPRYLVNRGYILFLQGKATEAGRVLAEAIQLGGDELKQAALKYAETISLPQDEEFKALINSL